MPDKMDIPTLGHELDGIIARAKELEEELCDELALVHPRLRASAANLVHYIALRQTDIRVLQQELAFLGVSSLGRAEKNVMATLHAVRKVLRRLSSGQVCDSDVERVHFEQSDVRLRDHIDDLLGSRANGRSVRIMVTLPTEAADEYQLVYRLIERGMDIARVNCGHDSKEVWLRMIANIRKANVELDCECRIVMDLAGPKIRTGALRPGPGVVHIRPKRDSLGRITVPRLVRFVPQGTRWESTRNALVPVPRECIEQARIGNCFHLKDTRGKKRTLRVVSADEKGLVLECCKNTYIGTGTKLKLRKNKTAKTRTFRVGTLPPIEEPILLKPGDTLILHSDNRPGERAVVDADDIVKKCAHISCLPPETLRHISVGDPIRLNDGKIEGIVKEASADELLIDIGYAKATGSKLRGAKGINFPKSNIPVHGLSATDKLELAFAVEHADAVGQSFVSQPEDVYALLEELHKYPASQLGIILKIETVKGFNNLPRLLLAAMRHYPAGVMIARGDMAVECGWVRLAEVQEEILWLCEAAQVPVIWATQVLERETQKGQPSRAEITDAAMSQRADCVMLNKGPHILAAIRMLDDILRRMQDHQRKKTPTLRKLSVTEPFD